MTLLQLCNDNIMQHQSAPHAAATDLSTRSIHNNICNKVIYAWIFYTTFMEIANDLEKREGPFATCLMHLLKKHLCTSMYVTTAGYKKKKHVSTCLLCSLHTK